MNNHKLATAVAILLSVVILLTIVRFLTNSSGSLVSPEVGQVTGKLAGQPTPQPPTTSHNPPKEIKYGGTTDLKKELESVNPQVLDEDFSSF